MHHQGLELVTVGVVKPNYFIFSFLTHQIQPLSVTLPLRPPSSVLVRIMIFCSNLRSAKCYEIKKTALFVAWQLCTFEIMQVFLRNLESSNFSWTLCLEKKTYNPQSRNHKGKKIHFLHTFLHFYTWLNEPFNILQQTAISLNISFANVWMLWLFHRKNLCWTRESHDHSIDNTWRSLRNRSYFLRAWPTKKPREVIWSFFLHTCVVCSVKAVDISAKCFFSKPVTVFWKLGSHLL